MTTPRAKNIEKIPNYWFSPRDSREQQGGVWVRGGCAAEPSCFPHLLPGTCSSSPGSTWVAAPLLSCSDKCGASGQVMGMCDCKCFPASWSQVMIVQICLFEETRCFSYFLPFWVAPGHCPDGTDAKWQRGRRTRHMFARRSSSHYGPSDGIWT